MNDGSLPPATRAIWKRLQNETALKGFLLVGGTALSLRIGHRESEDLDFAFPGMKLPIGQLEVLRKKFPEWTPNDNPASYDEFLNAGMSLHDYQQDFLTAENVKITFFAEDKDACSLLGPVWESGPRVAELAEIFALKALVSAKRSNSRDWFDLYTLIQDHGFTLHDFKRAFEKANRLKNLDIAFQRLCSAKPAESDPGFESLMPNPPTVEKMASFFRKAIDDYMVAESSAVLTKQPPPSC
ncbi:MAG: nucleotidyl transferase AbiEii/AbiGii toxin family protein [Spartobacteria bacterium]